MFTNLVHFIFFDKFISKNLCTVSIYTKLYLLNQISNIIRTLRNNNIVFHNIIPKRIAIKKNLIVNIFDFSNSYCKNLRTIK